MFRSCLIRTVARCLLCSTQRYSSTVDKSLLSKLRKKTGISLINCKKALEQFNNDLEKAEKWLEEEAQKEGWTKATKLQNRPMSQGLIGLVKNNNSATLIEVNCETDFVAKNSQFEDLVSRVAQVCHSHFQTVGSNKVTSASKELRNLQASNGKTVGDLIALEIGNLGENLSVRRASYINVPSPSILGTYMYAVGKSVDMSDECVLGKYGSVVELEATSTIADTGLSLKEVAHKLSQHIVGMSPQSIGSYEDLYDFLRRREEANKNLSSAGEEEEVESLKMDRNESASVETKELEQEEKTQDELEAGEESSDSDSEAQQAFIQKDESRLLFQDFLLDDDLTVGEFLEENAVRVKDFCRYECGEELESEEN